MFIVFVLRHRIIIQHFIKVYVKYTLADEITYVFTSGIAILILKKDDIEFVTEFPRFLGHPVNSNKHKLQLYTLGQGYPQMIRLQRRLYGIYLIAFLKFMVS